MDRALQAVRGMGDLFGEDVPYWQHLEREARDLFAEYGYQEIRVPLLERTELFSRSIGEFTDIVEKEMYTFQDRGGDSLTLRPEATAGMVRAAISNGLLHNQKHRLWTSGPMFRHERPQKGRYRQFHQLDCEALGFEGPDIDAEIILLAARLWRRLGLSGITLQINSLGTPESRRGYRDVLLRYLTAHRDRLDDDSRGRLESNPLRVLDSKNPDLRPVIEAAPLLTEHLDVESREHFAGVRARLDACGLPYAVNPRLVRGLDYYTRTVFEWTSDALGAQDAVCSGGRYDGLVAQLGGEPTPAIGWALGIERVAGLLREAGLAVPGTVPDVYVVLAGAQAEQTGLKLVEGWRDALPGVRIVMNAGGGGFKAQLRRADKSGAALAVIIGDDEAARAAAALKPLRTEMPQQQCGWQDVPERISQLLRGGAAGHGEGDG